MGLGVSRIRHVELPVSDLGRSRAWYQALLGLEVTAEFSEQGVVRGVQLTEPDGTVLRFLANNIINPGSFLGVDLGPDGQFSLYDRPRLTSG